MAKYMDLRVFVGVVITILLLTVGSVSGATITVDDSGSADYLSIQAAINNASAGDIIEVQSGVYLENVVVNKTLSLVGIGMPLVNASGSGTAITITAGDCIINGFNVTGSGTEWDGGDADSGIKLKSDNNTVLNSTVGFNNNGIYLYNSNGNTLIGNDATSNYCGIYLINSYGSTLTDNNVKSNYCGIYLYNSYGNTLTSDNATSNFCGINLYNSNGNTLTSNDAFNNDYGFYVWGSSSSNALYKNNLMNNINYNAYDTDGLNSWFYNHYSDYTGLDSNNDDIGDTAYYIAGDVGAKDMFPAMQTWNMDKNDGAGANFTLYSGYNIALYEGYTLALGHTDVDQNKAWITVEKDGNYVDNIIRSTGESFSYIRTIDGTNNLIFHGVLDNAFQGVENDFIKITDFYQFSDINGSVLIDDSNDLKSAPTITLSSPPFSSVSDGEGDSATFTANVYQVANVTWILDGVFLYTNTSVTTASYYNSSAKCGEHNLTVFAENANGSDQKKWTWVVNSVPVAEITVKYVPPSNFISNDVNDSRTFYATASQVANMTWILDGVTLYTNTSVIAASYYNNSAQLGTHNLTVIAENAHGTDQRGWTWIVEESISSETGADTLYIRGSVFNGSDITNNDMGYIGNNGNGILEINTSNFAGFYYDFNDNIGAEKFEILQNLTESYRTINKNGLVYTTSIMDVDYEQTLWTDQYQKICYFGEEYVPIKLNAANKLSNLLMDEKVSRTLRTGQSLELGEGYAITPQQIDVDGNKVWLELTKNGEFVADKIIEVAANGATNTWSYDQDIGSDTDIETFRIYVDQVFQGQTCSLVVIKGIWQISDSILELDTGTTAGLMEIQEIDSKIKMVNKVSIILHRGTTVDIAENIRIVVADSNDIRFHLSKGYPTPGIYEIRGEAYNLSSDIYGIIDYNNFAGFYYDLDSNIGTESLEVNSISGRTIAANSLIYTTVLKVAKFEYTPWDSYNVIGFMGEEYFAGYPAGPFGTSSSVSLISSGKLSKVLIDADKSRSIYSGSGLILEEGYVLHIDEVDINGNNVLVTLQKDGSEVTTDIIAGGGDFVYKKQLGSTSDVPIIAVHFKNIFRGTETNAVFVDGIFQISGEYITINNGDTYGKVQVVNIDSTKIEMKNDNSISLKQDSTIPIMGNIKFKVADDSNNVRYYPFTEVIIKSIPTESEPMSFVYDDSITEGDGYQINNYVIDVTDIFVSANIAVFKVYDKGTLKHDKMLSINDSFSFDFEDSTVQLTLRSTISGVLPIASVLIETNYNISDLHINGIVNGGHEYATYMDSNSSIYTMQLQKGWNLVSTPLTPDTPDVNTLFDNNNDVLLPVYSWNTTNKQYYDVNTIEISKGYWILALNDTQVTFAGKPYSG